MFKQSVDLDMHLFERESQNNSLQHHDFLFFPIKCVVILLMLDSCGIKEMEIRKADCWQWVSTYIALSILIIYCVTSPASFLLEVSNFRRHLTNPASFSLLLSEMMECRDLPVLWNPDCIGHD